MATVTRSWSVLRTWSWSVPRLELQHSTKLSEARTSEAKPHSFALPPFTELMLSTTQHVDQHCFMASGSDCGEGAIVSDAVPHLTRCYHGGLTKSGCSIGGITGSAMRWMWRRYLCIMTGPRLLCSSRSIWHTFRIPTASLAQANAYYSNYQFFFWALTCLRWDTISVPFKLALPTFPNWLENYF